MGTQHKQVGGGPAVGLANDFVSFLQQGLNTGSFGGITPGQRFGQASPTSQTMGIAGILNDLLAGGAGNIGGSMAEMISRDTSRQADAMRARFGQGGGMAFGTPAAYAEAMMRAEQAPKMIQAIGGLQMNATNMLMNQLAGMAGKGISQRENIAQPSGLASVMGAALPAAGMILGGPLGGPIGSAIGGMFGGGAPNLPLSMGTGIFPGLNLGPYPGMGIPDMQSLLPMFPPQLPMFPGYNLG